MQSIKIGKQYYASIHGKKTVVTVKGRAPTRPGFWTCEISMAGEYLSTFAVVEIPDEDILLDELPPMIPDDC